MKKMKQKKRIKSRNEKTKKKSVRQWKKTEDYEKERNKVGKKE